MEVEHLLQKALNSKYGSIFRTVNGSRLKQALYRARANARAKSVFIYDKLKFITSPSKPETDVWVIKESENGEPPPED